MKKRILSFLTVCVLVATLPFTAFAHSGRTDGSGGHKDNKNKSGLGSYHYHCGGHPAHLHKNGVCPYKSGGSTSSVSSTPKTVYATSITAKNVPSSINAGDTATLEASVYPTNAEDKTISWESSDTSVLTVSSTGALTAVGVGTATITAKTSRGTSKKFTVTVKEVVAESISLSANDNEILIGDTLKLKCAFSPKNTTNKTLEWTSSDENILSVSADGTVTAKNIGTATINAKHNDLSDSLQIEVKPVEVENIKITFPEDTEINEEENPKLKKDDQLQLNAEIAPDNATYKDVVWSVSDDNIASIDENGLLTANTAGTATVTATATNGVKTEIEIEIYSNATAGAVGIGSVAVISVGGIALYLKKKKKANVSEAE